MYELDYMDPGDLGQTRGNIGWGIVAIVCQNESYEVILKAIWGTVMILYLQ